jgi:hypothetical protein
MKRIIRLLKTMSYLLPRVWEMTELQYRGVTLFGSDSKKASMIYTKWAKELDKQLKQLERESNASTK